MAFTQTLREAGWTEERNVTIDNVDWATAPHFLEAKAIELDIRLWPILRGRFQLPKLAIDQPRVFLEKGAHG
jgi:uncharacterized protein involved in outer membrane biogenesis